MVVGEKELSEGFFLRVRQLLNVPFTFSNCNLHITIIFGACYILNAVYTCYANDKPTDLH